MYLTNTRGLPAASQALRQGLETNGQIQDGPGRAPHEAPSGLPAALGPRSFQSPVPILLTLAFTTMSAYRIRQSASVSRAREQPSAKRTEETGGYAQPLATAYKFPTVSQSPHRTALQQPQ